jgi:hypothetical protein
MKDEAISIRSSIEEIKNKEKKYEEKGMPLDDKDISKMIEMIST